jgi:hypothetical protein
MCFVFYRHLSPTDVASLVSQSPTVRPPDAFAPAQLPDAASFVRGKGTPQGGVISPLLSNLYLHWFDKLFIELTSGRGPRWCVMPAISWCWRAIKELV